MKSLLNKTLKNNDAIEAGIVAGLMVLFPYIPLGMAAVDATMLAAMGVGRSVFRVGKGIANTAKSFVDWRNRRHREREWTKQQRENARLALALARQQIQHVPEPAPDPLDRAQEEYMALQRRVCDLPLSDEEKKALHVAVERRFVKALKDRIDGLQ
ncbi:MAG TPA: hypothetical protein VHV55_26525 [Pirellulales bacterium]|nr:hypothetical protein [Pirellulales bacterium]